jgi:predicted PurR-regulated permease PerM
VTEQSLEEIRPVPSADPVHDHHESEDESWRRDRLLSSLNLLLATGLFFTVPFALKAGAAFFLPVTVAFTLAVTLVPPLEWLERRRVPSPLAALTCVAGAVLVINAAIAAILFPAMNWLTLLPQRIGKLRETLAPVLDAYASLQRFLDQIMSILSQRAPHAPAQVTVTTPNSLIDLVAVSAPGAVIQMLFGLLLIYFFLSTWTRMRKHTILSRTSLDGSIRMARTIRDMVNATAAYIGTITMINLSMGAVVSLVVWLLGMPTPLMWGGLAALFNYVPYVGPTVTTAMLAFGGLLAFDDVSGALFPAIAFLCIHALEANFITPLLIGRRLTINPLLILLSLSFWGWVWGTVGALLSVPLLIMMRVLLESAGKPDIAGFLFEERLLGAGHHEFHDNHEPSLDRPKSSP